MIAPLLPATAGRAKSEESQESTAINSPRHQVLMETFRQMLLDQPGEVAAPQRPAQNRVKRSMPEAPYADDNPLALCPRIAERAAEVRQRRLELSRHRPDLSEPEDVKFTGNLKLVGAAVHAAVLAVYEAKAGEGGRS